MMCKLSKNTASSEIISYLFSSQPGLLKHCSVREQCTVYVLRLQDVAERILDFPSVNNGAIIQSSGLNNNINCESEANASVE